MSVFQAMVIRYDNYNSLWSYAAGFISKLQTDLKIQQTNPFFGAVSPVTAFRCWNIEHLSLLPMRSLPPSSTTRSSNCKWVGPRSHRKSMRVREQTCISWCSLLFLLCRKVLLEKCEAVSQDLLQGLSVQFSRMLTRNLRKLIFSTKFYRVLPKEI